MPNRFELVVFDWDGTLMDSAAAIAESIQEACSDLGLPVPDEERARYVIGLGLHDALAHVAPDLDIADYPRMIDRYRQHFLHRDGGTRLFAGARELLEELRESAICWAWPPARAAAASTERSRSADWLAIST